MEDRAALVKFHGTVQGVYFRMHTEIEAKRLGLTGWVRNMPDGHVEALFEGDETSIKEAITYCRTSIPRADVVLFNVEWREPSGGFSGFETTH